MGGTLVKDKKTSDCADATSFSSSTAQVTSWMEVDGLVFRRQPGMREIEKR